MQFDTNYTFEKLLELLEFHKYLLNTQLTHQICV